MGIVGTFLIYLVIGIVVATAMWITRSHTLSVSVMFNLMTWTILWPFFAPLLFGQAVSVSSPPSKCRTSPRREGFPPARDSTAPGAGD